MLAEKNSSDICVSDLNAEAVVEKVWEFDLSLTAQTKKEKII